MDVSAACQLSDGRRFPGPPPRARFPAWAGVLIGIGVTMLVVMCVVAALLWRRRRRRSRRRDLEVCYTRHMEGLTNARRSFRTERTPDCCGQTAVNSRDGSCQCYACCCIGCGAGCCAAPLLCASLSVRAFQQMQGQDGRALQLGSDGSKLASTNGTFRVLDGNEKGEPGVPGDLGLGWKPCGVHPPGAAALTPNMLVSWPPP